MAAKSTPPEERQQIVALYQQGFSVNQVTERVRPSHGTVFRILQEEGVLRTRGIGGRPKRVVVVEEESEDTSRLSWRVIPELHQEGLSVPSIAKMLTVGEDYVELCLRRAATPQSCG
jgi:transposase